MTLMKSRGVKPQAAQCPDGRWVASAIAYWEEHGAGVSCPLSWEHGENFPTPEEAVRYAYKQGTLWLDKEHPDK